MTVVAARVAAAVLELAHDVAVFTVTFLATVVVGQLAGWGV